MLGASGNARKAGNVGFSLEALALLAIISASRLNHAETRESKAWKQPFPCNLHNERKQIAPSPNYSNKEASAKLVCKKIPGQDRVCADKLSCCTCCTSIDFQIKLEVASHFQGPILYDVYG